MPNYSYEPLNDHIYRIKDAFGAAMYLVIGKKRAALIDTGYGLTGLRSLVERLTDLPVTVLLTHGHIDHALGIFEFEDIYMHPADLETFAVHSDWSYRMEFLKGGGMKPEDFEFQSVRPIQFQPVSDDQLFDLGDLHIRACHTPGHTKGMTMYLFVEDRIMLFGDGCGPNTMIMEDCSGRLIDYYESLQRIKGLSGEYDRILRNHGTYESPLSLLDHVMEVCRRILAGTDDHFLLPERMQKMFVSGLNPVPLSYSARAMKPGPKGPVFTDGDYEGNINYREDKV